MSYYECLQMETDMMKAKLAHLDDWFDEDWRRYLDARRLIISEWQDAISMLESSDSHIDVEE